MAYGYGNAQSALGYQNGPETTDLGSEASIRRCIGRLNSVAELASDLANNSHRLADALGGPIPAGLEAVGKMPEPRGSAGELDMLISSIESAIRRGLDGVQRAGIAHG